MHLFRTKTTVLEYKHPNTKVTDYTPSFISFIHFSEYKRFSSIYVRSLYVVMFTRHQNMLSDIQ